MKRLSGITITEGAVLLFVVGMLGLALYPVFVRWTEPHRRSACQANLKAIGLGFKQYIRDSANRYPLLDGRAGEKVRQGGLTGTHWVLAVNHYVKDLGRFQCPNDRISGGTDYYYNKAVSGNEVINSANCVLLTEGPDISNCSQATATAPIRSGPEPGFKRHLDGSNYCFADGHVKWLQSSRPASDSSVAASGGGFNFGT